VAFQEAAPNIGATAIGELCAVPFRWQAAQRRKGLTTQWSGRPTAQALCLFLALYLWAAAHRER